MQAQYAGPIRKAVLLAGGLGMRLRPLTNIIPKPLLPIGESTILEIQMLAFKKHGVSDIYIASNYMSDYLESVVGQGEKYGVRITISREREPLGTCGPLSLLREQLNEPFFVMNGDILTDIDFANLGGFALSHAADLTIVTKEINIPFRFGRVVAQGDYVVDVEEKPTYKHEILAGIYAMKPGILNVIPDGKYYGIDTLIKDMLATRRPVAKYMMHGYWTDIGQLDDYEIAKREMALRTGTASAA
jgi:NDP-sugar pyrophosphorylase family protein